MASFLPGTTERIEDQSSELILSLELQRGEGCDLAAVGQAAVRLVDAFQDVLVAAEDVDRADAVDTTCALVENAYRHWKTVDAAFAQTIQLAYEHRVPRHNLLLDDIHTSLKQRLGEPLADTYTELRRRWSGHVESHPWDAFMRRAPVHVDAAALEDALGALAHGDDLDVEDALTRVTGELRYAFASYARLHSSDLDDLEIGLWKRPEIIVAGDYWGHAKRVRLIDVLAESAPERLRGAASTISGFFSVSGRGAASIAHGLQRVPEAYRERVARCLMMHPDHEVRRYAVNATDMNSIWKVLTPESVPCSTILTLLERLVGTSRYTTSQRKIFFDTVYRRFLSLTSHSDVLYARGIVRILVKLNFFLEDSYFHKLSALLDYLTAKERTYRIRDGLLEGFIARIRDEKERAGSVEDEDPTFDGIPLVVLRKLARDGHFWSLLAMHPIAKIARETVSHISTRDRALRVANNHRVNVEVLRAIGRKRELFGTLTAKLALLSNPQTPPAVSMDYLSDLTLRDVEALLRRATVHPELRVQLRARLDSVKR